MKYIKNFDSTEAYDEAKTGYEYPTVTLVSESDDNDVYYMGKPYWKATVSVTADEISSSTPIAIWCKERAYADGTEATYEHACGASSLKTVYYNGEDVTAELTDVLINTKYGLYGKGYTFPTTETAGDKEFIFIFKDSYNVPSACWANCSKVKSAVSSEAVEIIPAQLLYNTAVESFTIGKDVTFIGQQFQTSAAFKHLLFEEGGTKPLITGKQLLQSFGGTELILPDRCTTVGYDMVHSSSTLKKVVFGTGLVDLGIKIPLTGDSYTNEGAPFMSCSVLDTIVFKSTTPPTFHHDSDNLSSDAAGHIFRTCAKVTAGTAKIYVPAESVDLYKAADGFSEYADMITAITDDVL